MSFLESDNRGLPMLYHTHRGMKDAACVLSMACKLKKKKKIEKKEKKISVSIKSTYPPVHLFLA